MQIVIDIPKYVYDTIVASDGYIADCDNEKVGMAVKNGTPLPKDLCSSEVIPCKECKWHGYLTCSNPNGLKGWVTDNDFCSYVERRENVI